ncbi:lysylphosphatidylglycerol synthase transmembrane domain-containing protein [Ruegeria lacuscaerulensis]|uniref:lysylphosphatidylglycerol synthase transmembrane domain-containing protein n=1 Tax=Ruegeria lacuscaerulensis TaxID=55218 RepID=UPI00147B100B|nr:lysylphosphatidylglycerol synthase transmembrane domain-containing protein [Ruegeria lacuscaerulensis]
MMGRMGRILGSLALLGGLLWFSAAGDVWARLRETDLYWVLVAFVALTCSTLSMARRWQLTAGALGLELSYFGAVREYYLSLLANSALPGGVVGDVSRAIRTRHYGDLKNATQSVLAERLLGQAALLAIVFGGLFWALLIPGGIAWPTATGWLIAAALAVAAGLVIWLAKVRMTAGFTRFFLGLLSRRDITAHAVFAAVLLILGLYACARATGTSLPPEACYTILPLVLCAMIVPLSIAGWGWREGAAAALFPLAGATPEAGIAMGICYGAVMLLAALPAIGFLFLSTDHAHKRKPLENV